MTEDKNIDKEKAEKLVVKFFNAITEQYADWIVLVSKKKTSQFREAKRCAMVHCDEVIKFAETGAWWDLKDEWERIKSEIENL